MKRNFLLPLLPIFSFFLSEMAFSQQKPDIGCGFDGVHDFQHDSKIHDFEKNLQQYFFQKTMERGAAAAPSVVPVVVHIVHNGGAENIPDAQILKAIDHLNQAFAASGYFQNQGATVNAQIQFCPAKRDPDGKATTGITRTKSPLTDMVMETQDIQLKNLSRWKPTDYVNIWVVKEITSQSSGAGVAGYAYFPSSHGGAEDGMVCEAKYFGTSPADDGVFIHEMGHYFGLYHTFQGGCKNDDCKVDGDRICDTPPDQAKHTACPYNSCSTDVAPGSPFSSDVDDATSNFMDYSPFSCYHDFSPNQATRMQAVLATDRKSLLDSKGCGDPCSMPVAAMFSMPPAPFFAGQTINLTNQSTGATTFEWSANGAVFSNLENPTFTFPAIGNFEFTLKIGNSDANCSDKISKFGLAECPVVADFSASKTVAEVGETINFTNTSTGGATDFQWFINGVQVATSTDFSFSFTNPGFYSVVLISAGAFCQQEKLLSIKINSPCGELANVQIKLTAPQALFEIYKFVALPDGSAIHVGRLNNRPILARIDAQGNIIWQKTIESYGGFWDIEPLPNGQFVCLGGESTQPSWFLKINSSGDFLSAHDLHIGQSFVPPQNGGNVLAANPDGSFGFFLRTLQSKAHIGKVSSNGTVDWVHQLDSTSTTGNLQIAADGTGDFLAVVLSKGNGTLPLNVFRFSQSGILLGQFQYSFPQENIDGGGHPFLGTHANGDFTLFFTGRLGANSLNFEKYMLRCRPDGQPLWARKIASAGIVTFNTYTRKVPDDGWLICQSKHNSQGTYLMRFSEAGDFLWQRKIGNFEVTTASAVVDGKIRFVRLAGFSAVTNLFTIPDANVPIACLPDGNLIENISQIPVSMTLGAAVPMPKNYQLTDKILTLANFSITATPICAAVLPCPEICDNQLDDDGDGFVDCFDADCDCSGVDDCTVAIAPEPDADAFAMQLAWESGDGFDIYNTNTPLVANLNPQTDSIPEILTVGWNNGQAESFIKIFKGDGSDKNAPKQLAVSGNLNWQGPSPFSVADLDGNGIPEVISIGKDAKVRVFTNFDPAANPPMQLWATSLDWSAYTNGMVSLADFDGDGVSEIYYGTEIYRLDLSNPSAPTLQRPFAAGPNGGSGISSAGLWLHSSTAVDVLSVADCNGDPDCEGLELVAGYSIYSIDLSVTDGDGRQIKEQVNLKKFNNGVLNYSDGFSEVADVNLDGTPDIVVNSRSGSMHGVLVWNKNGVQRFYPTNNVQSFYGSGGAMLIANVFDDRTAGFAQDFPEILVIGQYKLYCFNENKASLTPSSPAWWTLAHNDQSGRTGLTAFDFNGDGLLEIVYRDETQLRVLYGGAAPFPAGVGTNRNWSTTVAISGTGDEYPVIADVDNDRHAEIVVTGFSVAMPVVGSKSKLQVLKSAKKPWMPARTVWNQFNYFGVNINDDLTVPKTQQKHWLEMGGIGSGKRPFNTHLAQVSSLNPLTINQIKVPDISVRLDSARCNLLKMEAFLEICNLGSAELPAATPVTFYTHDPTKIAAVPLAAPLIFSEKLAIGDCKKVMLSLGATYNLPVFAVINDDGSLPTPFNLKNDFPATDQPECNYENNIVQFQINYQPPTLDLGNDIFLCKNSIIELAADPNFEKYRWQDGSSEPNFTAFSAGKYWVEAFDACGFRHTDTIQIIENQVQKLDLPDVVKICEGENVSLAAAGFSKYLWSPADSVDCADCPAVNFSPKKSITIFVTAADGDCFVSDSVQINVNPKPQVNLVSQNGGCGSPASIAPQVLGTAPFQFEWSNATTDSVLITTQSGTYVVKITDANGCEAIDSATVTSTGSGAGDTQPPVLKLKPATVAISQNGTAAMTAGLFDDGSTDNCGIENWTVVPPFFDCSQIGTQTVVVTAVDSSGNPASQSVAVFIVDNLPPQLTCSSDLTASWCQPSVGYVSPVADDNCLQNGGQFVLAAGLPSGSKFPTGQTLVQWNFTDASGNTGSCSFTVTVRDSLKINLLSKIDDIGGGGLGSILIEISGGLPGFVFEWEKDGQPFSSAQNLTGLKTGSYLLKVTDASGCVAHFPPIFIDNLVAASEPDWAAGLHLLPNPTTGRVEIVFQKRIESGLKIEVFDAAGRLVERLGFDGSGQAFSFDLSGLPAGFYLLEIKVEHGSVLRKLLRI